MQKWLLENVFRHRSRSQALLLQKLVELTCEKQTYQIVQKKYLVCQKRNIIWHFYFHYEMSLYPQLCSTKFEYGKHNISFVLHLICFFPLLNCLFRSF